MSIGVSLLVIACIVIVAILLIKAGIPGGRIIQLPLEIGVTLLGITFAFNVVLVKVRQDFSIANYMPAVVQGWLGAPKGQGTPTSPATNTAITDLLLSKEAEKSEPPATDNGRRSTGPSKAATVVTSNSHAPRFLAVRTSRQGKETQVRLYDSRKRSWLDDETHVLGREPKEGSTVRVDGVTATYVRKRPSQ